MIIPNEIKEQLEIVNSTQVQVYKENNSKKPNLVISFLMYEITLDNPDVIWNRMKSSNICNEELFEALKKSV